MISYQLTLFADLFSALILFILLLSIVFSRQYKYNSTKALIFSMAITLAAILSDAFNYYCDGKTELDTPHMIAMAFTLLSVNFIETCVGAYINCYINEHKKAGVPFTYRFTIITAIVETGCLILTLILVVTGQIFTLTDGHQGSAPMYIIPFALDALASLFMIGYVLSHTEFISTRDAVIILSVVVFTAAGYLLDGMLPGYNFSVMFGLVAILLNYLLVKEREIIDLRNEDETRFRKRVQTVLSLSDNFEIIFMVNLDNGTYKVAHALSKTRNITEQDFRGKEHFVEKNRQFIMTQVHPDDREMVMNAISIDYLTTVFKSDSELIVSYRLLKGEKDFWYKMKVKPERSWPARHKILIGVFNNDDEHRREKEHELELEKQLTRYDLVHNMIRSGSWSFFFDSEKQIFDSVYSDELVRMFGYKPPVRMNFQWESIMHPDDLKKTKDAIATAISDETGKTTFEIEHRMRSKDGSYHWYHSSGRVLLNGDGSGELLGTHINTDAEHDKNELQVFRDNQYLFLQLRTNVFNYIATKESDPESFFEFLADQLIKNSGCDQVIFRKTDGYIMRRTKDGLTIPADECCENCRLNSYISQNSRLKGEYCIIDRENCPEEMQLPDTCPVKSLIVRIIYSEGKPKGYLALHFTRQRKEFDDAQRSAMQEIANLTNLGFEHIKSRENQKLDFERYRLIHEIVNSGMWSYRFNREDEVYKTEFSDDLYSIIGWGRNSMREDILSFQELIHPDDYEAAQKAFNATLHDKTCRTHYNSEFRMRNKKGEYHWFHSAGRVIRYKNGYGEFFGTHVNIDAEKKREELQKEIENARDNAEAASAAKSAFLFNMSHDIRTPLNAIIGFTDIAISHKTDEEKVTESLQKVKASGDYLLTIVNDVLDMSRIESGKTKIEETVTNVSDAAENVAELNIIAAKMKNIDFQLEKDEILYPYVLSDVVHIKQIIVNILNNAMKYTPSGGKIRYTIRQIPAENPYEIITQSIVKDNGIGMSKKFLSHIYDAFEREQNTTQSGIQGTGLGMSIVKRLTDLLGGTIDIQSKPHKGTTVTVSFTHRIASPEQINQYETERMQKEQAEMKIDEEKLIGKKLLLVEDNELNREISEEILRERGLLIETANNGLDALNIIKDKGVDYYDFVLMDIQMPVMDGYTATREIRKLPGSEKLQIAAFSANAFEEDRKRSLEAGMNIHVAKPINIKELTRSLASLL